MHSSVRSTYAEGPAAGGESGRLRAALGREAARRATRPAPQTAAPQPLGHFGVEPASVALVRQRAWLLPKAPFIAVWRLLLALSGIAGTVAVALLLDAGMALVQIHAQGR